jgi:UDP-glucose 4-epimerase
VLITSSSEVYGKNTADKLCESDDRILGSPLSLRWSYSEAKAIDESLAFAYWTEKQLQVRIVRLFNTVGPRQLGRYGMVVPRFVRSAILGEPVDIYGSGNQTRCFAHVFDVVNAIIAVAFSKNTLAKVVNIGNSSEISIFDLATDIIRELDSKSTIRYVSYMDAYGEGFEDMDRRVPDISLINSLVGWKPTLTLKQIIADTERYLRIEMKNES